MEEQNKQEQNKDEQNKEEKALYDYQIDSLYNRHKHINSHDIGGVKGFTACQMEELEKKKIKYRVDNELYLRKHPELNNMMSVFLLKVLEEKPQDILTYAGVFFDQPELQKIIGIETTHYLGKKDT